MNVLGTPKVTLRQISTEGELTILVTVVQKITTWLKTAALKEHRCRLQLKCDGTWWRKGGKWRGDWRMEWVASTLHTTSEHGVSSITTADVHTSAVSSRLNWRPGQFKWTRPFRLKTKSGFCACAITFQLASTVMAQDISGVIRKTRWTASVGFSMAYLTYPVISAFQNQLGQCLHCRTLIFIEQHKINSKIRRTRTLHSFEMLLSIDWYLVTDV